MARKNYPDEFKGDAVALYRDTDGATITQIAAGSVSARPSMMKWRCSVGGGGRISLCRPARPSRARVAVGQHLAFERLAARGIETCTQFLHFVFQQHEL